MNRRIKKVYLIELERGYEKETLKIVATKKLADQYIRKYEEKYPQNRISCNQADFVEII